MICPIVSLSTRDLLASTMSRDWSCFFFSCLICFGSHGIDFFLLYSELFPHRGQLSGELFSHKSYPSLHSLSYKSF